MTTTAAVQEEMTKVEEPKVKYGLWVQRHYEPGGHWYTLSNESKPFLADTSEGARVVLANGFDNAFDYRPTPYDPTFKGYPPTIRQARKPTKPDTVIRHMQTLHTAPTNARQLRAAVREIELPADLLVRGEFACNPSVAVLGGKLAVIVRLVKDNVMTRNVLGTIDLDNDAETVPLDNVRVVRDLDKHQYSRMRGFEDIRLVVRGSGENERLMGVAVTAIPRPHIALLDFDANGDIREAHVQPTGRDEKNWMPLVTPEGLYLVYALEPTTLLVRYNDRTKRVSPDPETFPLPNGILRGGAQVLPAPGGRFFAVVHHVHFVDGCAIYLHRFVEFDRFMRPIRMSVPWSFGRPSEVGIEFVAGMVRWGADLVMTFGHEDRSARVARVNFEDAEDMFDGMD